MRRAFALTAPCLCAGLLAMSACKSGPAKKLPAAPVADAPGAQVSAIGDGIEDMPATFHGDTAAVERAQDAMAQVTAIINVFPALMANAPCPAKGVYPDVLQKMAASAYATDAQVFHGFANMVAQEGAEGGPAFLGVLDKLRCDGGDQIGFKVLKNCEVFAYTGQRGNEEWVATSIVKQGTRPPLYVQEKMALGADGKLTVHTYDVAPENAAGCGAISSARRHELLCKSEPHGPGCGAG